MLKTFRKIRSDREDVKQLQDAVASTFQQVVNKEILDGILLEGIELVATEWINVEHKLGRAVRGYIVVRTNASGSLSEDLAANPAPTKFIRLSSDQTRTISLWVF